MGHGETKKGKLQARRTLDVPLREVSGICLRRGADCEMSLLAVGDRAATLAEVRLPSGDDWSSDWQLTDLATAPRLTAADRGSANRSDLRGRRRSCAAVAGIAAPRRVDRSCCGACRRLHRAYRRGRERVGPVVVRSKRLARGRSGALGERSSAGRQGEEARRADRIRAAGGPFARLLRGAALADGARGRSDKATSDSSRSPFGHPTRRCRKTCDDFSDLEFGPDGLLYLLSDKSASVARIDALPPGGGVATLTAAWRLDDLNGKPEGLAFARTGHAIVALDKAQATQQSRLAGAGDRFARPAMRAASCPASLAIAMRRPGQGRVAGTTAATYYSHDLAFCQPSAHPLS